MVVLSVINQKGGVAKSTTATCIAKLLSDRIKPGTDCTYRVLLVDMDPQGNATCTFGVETDDEYTTLELLKNECTVAEAVKTRRGVDIIPADIALATLEPYLSSVALGRERRLAKHLATVANQYDVAIIDCPPSLGLLTTMALAASTHIIVPADSGKYALKGFGDLVATVAMVREEINEDLTIAGILLTKYDARTKSSQRALNNAGLLAHDAGTRVIPVTIPLAVAVPDSEERELTVVEAAPASKPALAYKELVERIDQWIPELVCM